MSSPVSVPVFMCTQVWSPHLEQTVSLGPLSVSLLLIKGFTLDVSSSSTVGPDLPPPSRVEIYFYLKDNDDANMSTRGAPLSFFSPLMALGQWLPARLLFHVPKCVAPRSWHIFSHILSLSSHTWLINLPLWSLQNSSPISYSLCELMC